VPDFRRGIRPDVRIELSDRSPPVEQIEVHGEPPDQIEGSNADSQLAMIGDGTCHDRTGRQPLEIVQSSGEDAGASRFGYSVAIARPR
jgi:hypothetical protein